MSELRIHKHDTQLHMIEFLAHVRRFKDFTKEGVIAFSEAFWELMEEYFGREALKERLRLYNE